MCLMIAGIFITRTDYGTLNLLKSLHTIGRECRASCMKRTQSCDVI